MVAAEQFDSIATLKDATLADLATWPEAQLRYKPSPEEWCALEVLDHLARTDAGITRQMRSKAASSEPLSLANHAAGKAFNLMFRSPIRVKTPASASAILPTMPTDFVTVAAAWDKSILELNDFLASLDTSPDGGVFRHPVAGPMSLQTALTFLETHTRHHLHQFDRLRSGK